MRKLAPDLVICDVKMSPKSGFSLLSSIRTYPPVEHVPFVFLSGETSQEYVRRGHRMGADAYLAKPLDADELLDVVAHKLKRTRAFDERLERFRTTLALALPHELRTPLTGLVGLSSILTDHAEQLSGKPAELQEIGQALEASAARMARLVESYLIFSELTMKDSLSPNEHQGCDTVTPETKIAEIIREQSTRIAEAYRRTDDLSLEIEDAPIPTRCEHQTYFVKLSKELLDNAFKFSQPGEAVQVTFAADADAWMLTVSDNGRGMSAEEITQRGAFVQFNRARHEHQGLGLGLALCELIARAVGAGFELESEPEKGTTVRVSKQEANR